MNPEIFKAYDIRGVYPKDIDEDSAFKIGRGLVIFLKSKNPGKKTIILGKDNRISSPALFKSFKEGVKKEGADVIDIGLTTTPMFYFASNYFKADGGAMITASHNPKEYNGFKVIKENSVNIGKDEGMEELAEIVKEEKFSEGKEKGKEKKEEILSKYLKFNFSFLRKDKISPLKIVIDTANATSSPLIDYFKKEFNQIEFYHLFPELDGNFPNHEPDPIISENLKELIKEVKEKKADFGVAFDGDADRIVFVDEKGDNVDGDLITALLSKIILQEEKGAKILADISSSKTVEDTVKENGGKFYLSRTGHSYIKPMMAENNIYFAGEKSGHYYLGKNHNFETPLFVLFKIIEELSKEKTSLSEIISSFKKYVNSGEINFKIKDRESALREIENYFNSKNYKISKIDGIKAEGKDFWCLVRPSNTEPLLRTIVESESKEVITREVEEIKKILSNFS